MAVEITYYWVFFSGIEKAERFDTVQVSADRYRYNRCRVILCCWLH